jgi:hypothetical protein
MFPLRLSALVFIAAGMVLGAEDPALRVFAKGGCAGCHNPDGVASATRLKFASAEHVEAPEVAPGLVDRADPARSMLVQKPTRRVAHAGGKRIEPGSPEEGALIAWIGSLKAGEKREAGALKSVGPVMRRLTHAQYNNTVRDLLGDDSRIADTFPPEDFVNGFRNQYQSQSVSPMQAEAYGAAAEKLTRKAFAGDVAKIVPCRESESGCAEKFIRTFGQRAFRRPLGDSEVARYRKLFANGGARVVVETMLQSPNFLLRTENGLDKSRRPYEVASQLSYFLWNTMPDGALLRAAAAGELDTPAGVEKQARRLIADGRARAAMNEFLLEWLRFDRLTGTVRDRRQYPQFSQELVVSMLAETRRLFEEVAWEKDRNFMDLYSAEYGFLTPDMAVLYGVKAGGDGKVTFPASTERAGVLGQATFLALTSKPAETSPTSRGLFVREQFLCQDVPQPPPGVNANLPAISKDQPQTTRQRLGAHLNNESCASCHSLIDPIGFGFEKYDAIGQRRDKQKLSFQELGKEGRKKPPTTVELDIDTSGQVAGIPDSAFTSPRELGRILAGSAQCQECVVKQVFRWASGRHETAVDRVVIRKVFDDFRASGFRFPELLVSMARELAR